MCSSGLDALSCPFSTKFLKSTDLRFTTSPAIATYTLLPPVLPFLLWFVSLFVVVIFMVLCRAVGHFFKLSFFFWVGFASSLTKLWTVRWLVRPWQCACKCARLIILFDILISPIKQFLFLVQLVLQKCFS